MSMRRPPAGYSYRDVSEEEVRARLDADPLPGLTGLDVAVREKLFRRLRRQGEWMQIVNSVARILRSAKDAVEWRDQDGSVVWSSAGPGRPPFGWPEEEGDDDDDGGELDRYFQDFAEAILVTWNAREDARSALKKAARYERGGGATCLYAASSRNLSASMPEPAAG